MTHKLGLILTLAIATGLTGTTDSAKDCMVGFFGPGCRYECHCDGGMPCDPSSGRCPRGCKVGWLGRTCQTENVALEKDSHQRSTYGENTADLAVDLSAEQTCAMTRPGYPGSWVVDLKQNYLLHRMSIKSDVGGDLKGVRVYVGKTGDLMSSSLCASVPFYTDQSHLACELPLVGRYVHVVNTDSQLVLCDIQIFVCSDYRFGGSDCDGVCRCENRQEVCNKTNGVCQSGCAAGWTGLGCQTACRNTFGSGCLAACGHCRGGIPCDPVSGVCVGGCEAGWRGTMCDRACVPGSYDRGCAKMCGHCLHTSCDSFTGACPRGCESGWMGARCDRPCPHGSYGENCAFTCGSCRSGSTCDTSSGLCPMGCKRGWRGVFCTLECREGTYGDDCAGTCENCNNAACNRTTGQCDATGCKTGWSGPKCNHKCDRGKFGTDCETECGHCRHGATCDPHTGVCSLGCSDGWTGPACKEKCKRGFYGEDCEVSCGVCFEGKSCHHVTGKCPGVCSHGYSGPLCQKKLLIDPTGHLLTSVVLGTGTVVFGTLLAFIVCLVIRWRQDDIQDDGEEDEKRIERRAPLLRRLDSI